MAPCSGLLVLLPPLTDLSFSDHGGKEAIAVPAEGITVGEDLSDPPEGMKRYTKAQRASDPTGPGRRHLRATVEELGEN